jgi:sigma-54 specific flagellar transcriptional regulator A
VRELANLVERMAIMHPGAVVGARDLPLKFRHALEELGDEIGDLPPPPVAAAALSAAGADPALLPVNGLDLREYIQGIERSLIQQALDDCAGVVARAAERLRLRRTTLVEKMRKYEMAGRGDAAED